MFLTACTTTEQTENTQTQQSTTTSSVTQELVASETTETTISSGTTLEITEIITESTTISSENPDFSEKTESNTEENPDIPEEYTDVMEVHFIDVDQGDSTFIELPNGKSMLIDAGETDQGDKVVTYLHKQGYDTIDYVVATHPHSDHIGGIVDVINNFNVNYFYRSPAAAGTDVYNNMIDAVKANKIEESAVMAGDIILDEANLLIEVVAPKEIDNDEQNNNSVVIKLTYGDNKFLFTGDAEKAEEDGIWTNIKCDVLKVGHHGSDSSSSDNFLKKVEPKYAIISCGLGNSYGHPTEKVLNRLYERNIDVYRTDIQGTIVLYSDGKTISFDISPYKEAVSETTTTFEEIAVIPDTEIITTAENQETSSSITYVLNTKSKKIHYSHCSSVDDMKEENKDFTDDYDGSIADGYVPCKRCDP